MPLRSFIYIVLLLIGVMAPIRAQPTYWIEPGGARSLDGFMMHYEDTTAQLTIEQITVKQNQFKLQPGSLLNRGYTASHHWLHIRLNARTSQTAYLELDNPRINAFWFYQINQNRLVSQAVTGDERPFSSRGFPSYNWVFPVALDGKTPADLYIMVAKRHEVLGVRVKVWEGTAFERNDRNNYLFWGLLTGFTLLILLINLVAFLATRQAIYGWFIGLILAIAFHISTQSGLGFQYLWANQPGFNRYDPQLLSGWLIMLAQLQFMQHFIDQKADQSRAFWAVQAYKHTLVGLLVLNVMLRFFDVFPESHFRWTFNATLLFTVISILLAFWSIFERIRQREKVVLFYTFTFSVQLIGYVVVFFINLAFTQGRDPLFQIDSYVVIVTNFLFDLLILSSGILYFWFQSYREQNEKLLTALHQHEQAQSNKVIEALEIERNRIAEDLYDDVGAMLSTAIGFVSSVLRKPDVRETFPLLTEARQLLVRAVDNLRTVSHNLMPKNFAELGLAKSLAETIDKVSASTDIRFRFIVAGPERRLDASTEVQIFRIAVELINDIVKNSDATEATFQLVYGEEGLILISEDDGPNPPQYNNLHSKVAFINGKIDTDISPSGVTVLAEIPY
jgi:two-component system, sensor histidine kinase LadS